VTTVTLLTCLLHPVNHLALYSGLLAPAFVACSTNTGEGLVKLSHVQWRTWTCGGVAHSPKKKQQVSECGTDRKHRQ